MSAPPAVRVDLGFAWALKRSFVEYIAGMHDGHMSLEGDAAVTSTREFYFPFLSAAGTPGGNVVARFQGGLLFTAHHGLLSVPVRGPVIRIEGNYATISVESAVGAFVLANVEGLERTEDDDVAMFHGEHVTLAESGVALFGDTYAPNAALAPVTVRIPQSAHAVRVE